jgi:hypothetical protein
MLSAMVRVLLAHATRLQAIINKAQRIKIPIASSPG